MFQSSLKNLTADVTQHSNDSNELSTQTVRYHYQNDEAEFMNEKQ